MTGEEAIQATIPVSPAHRLIPETKCRIGVLNLDEFIEFGGDRYRVIRYEDGRASMLRYNEKYKMWVQLNFTAESDGGKAGEFIIGVLSNQFIERITGDRGKAL